MPELVGHRRKFIVGKHVGTKGLNNRLQELGIEVNDDQLNEIFLKVKDLGDKGKTVTDTDLEAIAEHVLNIEQEKKINLDELTIVSGNKIRPTASIKMNIEDKEVIEADVGIGPVDAAINAVNKGIKNFADIKLEEYHVDAVTGGTDTDCLKTNISLWIKNNPRRIKNKLIFKLFFNFNHIIILIFLI